VNKFPKSYVPESTEWKGLMAITTNKLEEVKPVVLPTVIETVPDNVQEKEGKIIVAATYILFLTWLDNLLTKIRLKINWKCPDSK
jgi:hypothetical protein